MTLLHVRTAAKRTGIPRVQIVKAIKAGALAGYCRFCTRRFTSEELLGGTRHSCEKHVARQMYPVLVYLEEVEKLR